MKILIVDAFLNASPDSTHGRGKTGFSLFYSMVLKSLKCAAICPGAELLAMYPPVIQIVGVQKLLESNLICDGERSLLDHHAENACKSFDSIDIIYIGGDSCTPPLDHRLGQLIVLCNMARMTNKPVFTCGGAAIVEIVSLLGCGTIWHDVHGGGGGSDLSSLPLSPCYSSADNNNAVSVFYDASNGDLYSFDVIKRSWNPMCNIGLSRRTRSGKMITPRIPSAALHFSVDDHVKDTSQELQILECDLDQKAHIDKRFVQHWIFEGLSNASHAFVVTSLGEFGINRNTPSDASPHFNVLATSKDSPILLNLGHKFVFAAEINDGKSRKNMEQLIANFTRKMAIMILTDEQFDVFRRLRGSLHYFVFSEACPIHDYSRHAAISNLPVKSRLPDGSVEHLTSDSNSGIRQNVSAHQDDLVHKTSTGIPKTRKIFKVPQEYTFKRLEELIASNGQCVQSSIELIRSDSAENNRSPLEMSPIRPRVSKPTSFGLGGRQHRIVSETPATGAFCETAIQKPGDTRAHLSVFETGNISFREFVEAKTDSSYLPRHSPRSTTLQSNDTQYTATATRVNSPRSKPLSTYKLILSRKSMQEGEYVGQYTEVYMTPREKEMNEDAIRKRTTRHISDRNFITSFGRTTAIPLRKEGQIRPFSFYESENISAIGVKACDRIALRKDEKAKHIAGQWRNA